MNLADHLRSNAVRSRSLVTRPPLDESMRRDHASSTKIGAEAGAAPGVRSIATRPRFAVVAIVGLILVLASAFAWRRWRAEVSPADSVVAVLPFSARGEDGVAPLGEGFVNLLGAALDGADSLRPVDARAVFAAVADAGGVARTTQTASGVATRLGAGMYVLGDVIQAGNQLQIEAAIYRVGRAEPSTRAVVSEAADSVFALVDRLAAQLLGELGHPAADRLVRTASVTTASLPAFKAYLRGEALMRAGQLSAPPRHTARRSNATRPSLSRITGLALRVNGRRCPARPTPLMQRPGTALGSRHAIGICSTRFESGAPVAR